MNQSAASESDAGITLVEMLVTLVIIAMLVGVIAVTIPHMGAAPLPGSEGALAFLQSERSAAISTGEPRWLSVWDNRITDGTASQELAAGTIRDQNGGPVQEVSLLMRADGSLVGQPLRVATQTGEQDLFVWPVGTDPKP